MITRTSSFDMMDMSLDEACEYLTIGTLNAIHEFDMTILLSEYKYLAENGHEMPLTEGAWDSIKEKVTEIYKKVKVWITEAYEKLTYWIADKMEAVRQWLQKGGMSKEKASAAVGKWNTIVRQLDNDKKTVKSIVWIMDFDGIVDRTKRVIDQMSDRKLWGRLATPRAGTPTPGGTATSITHDYIQDNANTEAIRNLWLRDAHVTGFFKKGQTQPLAFGTIGQLTDTSNSSEVVLTRDIIKDAFKMVFESKLYISDILKIRNTTLHELDRQLREVEKEAREDKDYDEDGYTKYDEETTNEIRHFKRFMRAATEVSKLLIQVSKTQFNAAVKILKKAISIASARRNILPGDEYANTGGTNINASAMFDYSGLDLIY